MLILIPRLTPLCWWLVVGGWLWLTLNGARWLPLLCTGNKCGHRATWRPQGTLSTAAFRLEATSSGMCTLTPECLVCRPAPPRVHCVAGLPLVTFHNTMHPVKGGPEDAHTLPHPAACPAAAAQARPATCTAAHPTAVFWRGIVSRPPRTWASLVITERCNLLLSKEEKLSIVRTLRVHTERNGELGAQVAV